MPIIKSAKKRVKTARKATILNVGVKRTLKAAQKELRQAITGGNKQSIAQSQRNVQSSIDQAVKKNLMSKHKAARRKQQLVAQVKSAGGANPTKTVKATTKAAPVKKKPTTTKAKTPTKAKTAAKKPVKKKA